MLKVFHLPTGALSIFLHFSLGPQRLTEMDNGNRFPHPPASRCNCLMGHPGRRLATVGHRVTVVCDYIPHPGTPFLSGALYTGLCVWVLVFSTLQASRWEQSPLGEQPLGDPVTLCYLCK